MSKKKTIRRNFKAAVLKRDNYACKCCGYQPLKDKLDEELDAHHITDRNEMPNGGYVKENGITLCNVGKNCHLKAEKFHISHGQDWFENMHPNDLYKMINSSKELAVEASLKL